MNDKNMLVINEKKERALERLYKLSYFFSNEMFVYIKEEGEFKKKYKEAKECDKPVIMVSTATNNKECMQRCLQATNEVINYLRKKENAEYLENWQLDGINAMLDRCKESIPFDLPYAIQAVLGMWEELEKSLNK